MATTIHALSSAQSLAHRARIASIISSLRPSRFRTPMCNLQAHRIPTLWSLYRGLLRDAPSDDVRWRIRRQFRRQMQVRKASTVKVLLQRHHKLREAFAAAKAGDAHMQAVVQRYARMVTFRRKKARNMRMFNEMLAWRHRLANRSILTGAFRRPTLYHGPLPEMKPWPMHIARLIAKRRKLRVIRIERALANRALQDDIARECDFERTLGDAVARDGVAFHADFAENEGQWLEHLVKHERDLQAALRLDEQRARRPWPAALIEQILKARRDKIANKTRELQRERAGLVLRRTIRRRAQGPPAHILARMTEEERHMDKAARSISEVGYVAMVKRRMGRKLKDPEGWKVEFGRPEEQARLDREASLIAAENERRRMVADELLRL
ncbi:hypothetical protein DAEQUDRAFT_699831 [Daedalea quercina L-15889]|uniref:Uncharacterized protein n=1 Tax=Daedalea quercina L-15889 TaxID=1314783 RepID=A0A165KWA1_9APHY|nr:hypothetical protein DAEQUDRAFT_699831 [Daedalea quercina L-15889]